MYHRSEAGKRRSRMPGFTAEGGSTAPSQGIGRDRPAPPSMTERA